MPVSGYLGTNLKDTDQNVCPFYTGPSFLDYLDSLGPLNREDTGPVRLPILDRFKVCVCVCVCVCVFVCVCLCGGVGGCGCGCGCGCCGCGGRVGVGESVGVGVHIRKLSYLLISVYIHMSLCTGLCMYAYILHTCM